MAVKKGIITYSFLYEDTIVADSEVLGMSCDDIMNECASGELIGNFDELKIEDVKPEDVHKELLEMGNDGTFFGRYDEDEDGSDE